MDDTTETMRQKVASAVGLAEDSFHMGFGGKDERDDVTQLSAGEPVVARVGGSDAAWCAVVCSVCSDDGRVCRVGLGTCLVLHWGRGRSLAQ